MLLLVFLPFFYGIALSFTNSNIYNSGKPLTEIWGYQVVPNTRTVDNHILKLRQKLEGEPANPRFILSVYGEGYKFVG